MVTEAVVTVFVGLAGLVVGVFPTAPAPGWLSDGAGYFADVWVIGAGLSAWIPWNLVGVVAAAVLACLMVGLVIKVVRIVASFFLAGGGSAG